MSATVAFPIDPSLNTAGDKQHSRDQQTKEDQLGKRKSESKGRSTHNNRPFLLLLPIYISTKSYWREFVAENKRADGSMDPYYIVPPDSYSYLHPEGTGKDKSPFFSCWFLGLFGRMRDIKVNQCLKRQCLLKVSAAVGAISVPRNVTAYTSPEQLIARGYVSEKRANPKQRRKTKGLLGTVAVTAVSTPPGPNKLLSSDKSKKHIDKNMDPSNNSDAVHIKKKKKRY